MSATLKNSKRVFEFDIPNLITSQVTWGRTTTIRADRMTVTLDERHGLHVLAEGRVIRRDGSEGQGYRAVAWTDDGRDADDGRTAERFVDNAPRWVRDAVEEVTR